MHGQINLPPGAFMIRIVVLLCIWATFVSVTVADNFDIHSYDLSIDISPKDERLTA
jgi:hypothetical protein